VLVLLLLLGFECSRENSDLDCFCGDVAVEFAVFAATGLRAA
jgi:hypothetical protein